MSNHRTFKNPTKFYSQKDYIQRYFELFSMCFYDVCSYSQLTDFFFFKTEVSMGILLQSCRFNICNSEASLNKSEGILGDRVCTCNPSSCGQIHSWYSFTDHFNAFLLRKNLHFDGFIPGMNFSARIKNQIQLLRVTPLTKIKCMEKKDR